MAVKGILMNKRQELQKFWEQITGRKLSETDNLESQVLDVWKNDRANLKRYQAMGALAACIKSLDYFQDWITGMTERAPKLSEEARRLNAEWKPDPEDKVPDQAGASITK